MKALAGKPAKRYRTAMDLHADLRSFLYTSGEFFFAQGSGGVDKAGVSLGDGSGAGRGRCDSRHQGGLPRPRGRTRCRRGRRCRWRRSRPIRRGTARIKRDGQRASGEATGSMRAFARPMVEHNGLDVDQRQDHQDRQYTAGLAAWASVAHRRSCGRHAPRCQRWWTRTKALRVQPG